MSFQLDPNDNPQEAPAAQGTSRAARRSPFDAKLIIGLLLAIAGIALFLVFPEAELSNNFFDQSSLVALGRLVLILIGAILVAMSVANRGQHHV